MFILGVIIYGIKFSQTFPNDIYFSTYNDIYFSDFMLKDAYNLICTSLAIVLEYPDTFSMELIVESLKSRKCLLLYGTTYPIHNVLYSIPL